LRILIPIAFFSFIFLFAITCKKKDAAKEVVSTCDSTGTISYSSQIKPIFNSSCGTNSNGCHSAASSFGDLTNYNGVKIHLPQMILHCVLQDDPNNYKPMPLGAGKLSDCNIAKIRNWVAQGYPNN